MVSFQRDRHNLPLSFHLVNNKSNDGEVKPSGRRVKMEGQFNPMFEFNMELELVEVDCDGVNSGISRYFFHGLKIIERKGDFNENRK
jgi:hypothetical protein